MRFPLLRTTAWVLPLILASAIRIMAQAPGSMMPYKPKGTLLLLHYRWQHDSLTLIDSKRIPAAVKASRMSPEKRSRGRDAAGGEPRSAFSFELLGADGKRISTRYLQDPGLRRVEYQEKGQRGLKTQEERVDSADIFLRIPDADAKTIRFFRHAEPHAHLTSSSKTAAKAKAAAKPAKATATTAVNGGAPEQGPEPLSAKSLVAEFPLE